MRLSPVLPMLLTWALLALALPREARACGPCGAGDPTLTAMGTEQPFPGRLRGSFDALHRRDGFGDRMTRIDLRETVLGAGLSYAFSHRAALAFRLPAVYRDVTWPNLGRDARWGLGDAEVRARFVLYRDRTLGPRTLVRLMTGATLPTSRLNDIGRAAPVAELRAGGGVLRPTLGLSLARFRGLWSVFAAASATPAFGRYADVAPGHAGRALTRVQVQPHHRFALRGGAELRLETPTKEYGATDPNTGGALASLTLDAVAGLTPDLLLSAGIVLPIWNGLRGDHHEGWALRASLVRDLGGRGRN